jgi:hypothetical protein
MERGAVCHFRYKDKPMGLGVLAVRDMMHVIIMIKARRNRDLACLLHIFLSQHTTMLYNAGGSPR